MQKLKKHIHGSFCIYSFGDDIDASILVDAFAHGETIEGKGRGYIRILHIGGKKIACRRYVHGGLLRGMTRGWFFSGKRAIKELEVITFLKNAGFPVVEPFCAVIETQGIRKIPYILTVYEENAVDMLDYLSNARTKTTTTIIIKFAAFMYELEKLGVYHPDLHLSNVLITEDNEMKFLDFDKASVGRLTVKDVEHMFLRLNRHIEKMAKKGYKGISLKEKILFLKSYERLSRQDILHVIKKRIKVRRFFDKIGWLLDSLFYGGRKF